MVGKYGDYAMPNLTIARICRFIGERINPKKKNEYRDVRFG